MSQGWSFFRLVYFIHMESVLRGKLPCNSDNRRLTGLSPVSLLSFLLLFSSSIFLAMQICEKRVRSYSLLGCTPLEAIKTLISLGIWHNSLIAEKHY